MSLFHEWFSMGIYNWYVWPAYCLTLLVFGANLGASIRAKKRVKKIITEYLMQTLSSNEP